MPLSSRTIALAVIVVTFTTLALLHFRGDPPSVAAAVAHSETVAAEHHAAVVDTLYLPAKAQAAIARAGYRSARDSALSDLRDTALTKRAFALADTAFIHDTVTLVRADTVMAAERAVSAAVKKELAIAVQRPRLSFTGEGLYEPLAGTPAVSASVALRLVRSLSAIARCDVRLVVGEHPHCYVGGSVTL
ncbi:MAG: hypothetical protein JWM95_757 [Gemmatimonadetes bacterium]|nr:hypothetical protein [Gemmatimonadota bacterium]